MMLRGLRVFVQGASLLNGLEFDPLTLFEDSLAGPEVDVLRRQIVQALMIPPCVVVMDELADRSLQIARQVIMLKRDAGRKELLESPQADDFIHGAAKFAKNDPKTGLLEMSRALKPHAVANWTAATYLPFLWQPAVHMFLKPEVTKAFASRVGHPFFDVYDSNLDPSIYSSLLNLVSRTKDELTELNPRDLIDVQSFIWVVGEYTPEE